MYAKDCRYFTGYKPCSKNQVCSQSCGFYSPIKKVIVFIHLGALGAVVRSTAIVRLLRQQNPDAYIIWITGQSALELLKNFGQADMLIANSAEAVLKLKHFQIDTCFTVDRSVEATAIAEFLQAKKYFGFRSNLVNSAVIPANTEAQELYDIGINDDKKFFINQKSELQLQLEALALTTKTSGRIDYLRLPKYNLRLSSEERLLCSERKAKWQKQENQPIIGFNVGCSQHLPYKKWTVHYHKKVIEKLHAMGFENIVLLGGQEDQSAMESIAKDSRVVVSPFDRGLRDGLVSVCACDIVVSGDSLGMHMAIAQSKYVVAWFGPTCEQEIELFGLGKKLLTKATCSPCWKRSCDKNPMCYDLVDQTEVLAAIAEGAKKWQIQQSKKHNQILIDL